MPRLFKRSDPEVKFHEHVAGIEAIVKAGKLRPGNQEVSTNRIVQYVDWLETERDPFGIVIPVRVYVKFTNGDSLTCNANAMFNMRIQHEISI